MVLYLNEDEVKQLIDMRESINALRDTFNQQGLNNVINNPRQRVRTGKSMLHYLAGALPHLGVMGYKAYTSSREGLKFRVFLHNIDDGSLLSVMDGNYMGMIRTGAVTGLATSYMSREDSSVLGVFGTGFQAEGQIKAVCEVRNIVKIKIYGRNERKKTRFCNIMAEQLSAEAIPVNDPDEVVEGTDIIVTATTSSVPVFEGKLLQDGTHINAIGGNFLFKREIDEKTVNASRIIAVESVEQCRIESGELVVSAEKGKIFWNQIIELGDIVSGRKNGRYNENDITLFKSVGIAIEDICIAKYLYDKALEKNIGKEIDIAS